MSCNELKINIVQLNNIHEDNHYPFITFMKIITMNRIIKWHSNELKINIIHKNNIHEDDKDE